MTVTEIIIQASEFKLIAESLNGFALETNRSLRNVQFLSREQAALKDRGEKAKKLADGLEQLSSETTSYVIRRIESN